MKTSNKLLLGLLIFVLASITILMGVGRFHAMEREDNSQEAVAPPAAPEAPEVPGASE